MSSNLVGCTNFFVFFREFELKTQVPSFFDHLPVNSSPPSQTELQKPCEADFHGINNEKIKKLRKMRFFQAAPSGAVKISPLQKSNITF